MPTKILILCTGNSCRSQMAEGFLNHFDSNLHVRSAGTEPASRVNPNAIKTMGEINIDISKGVPENVETYLDEKWDYVITVCDHANETCPTFSGKVKQRRHIGFDDPADATGTDKEIASEFCRIRDEIEQDFRSFYSSI
jgi:arsenate reductase